MSSTPSNWPRYCIGQACDFHGCLLCTGGEDQHDPLCLTVFLPRDGGSHGCSEERSPMIPQTAAPPPGTGGVPREMDCSAGFANRTPPFFKTMPDVQTALQGLG